MIRKNSERVVVTSVFILSIASVLAEFDKRRRMKWLVGLLVTLLPSYLAFSEMIEIKCDEIKAISYYLTYGGIKCTISDVSADSSSTFVMRSSNNFEYSKTIQEIEFVRSKLYDMPREIFGTFQFLKKVQANSCGLEDLNKYNFNYAISLQELRLRSNKIKKLPNSVFSSIRTLQTLDLSSNEISEMEPNAFANLINLEYLTLTSNKLAFLNENMFNELVALISIRLDSNKLQILEENIFANNLNLTEIRLDTNEIAIINGDVFGKLKRLKLLNLASNRLHKIDIVNTNLERLWIPYNRLKSLDVNKNLKLLNAPYNELEAINFTGNTEMMELKLRQNLISDISNLSMLNKLEILDLSFNPIGELKISSFARMSDLVKLNLESTNISSTSLTFGTFAHNINLTHLDISYNQLKLLDFSIFTSLTQLSHLKIDGNNLTEISFETMKVNFPKLSLISMVDNDWNCTYLSNMIKQLRAMNVIVYVFQKLRVFDETNVDGIRCHNNKTQHVYWKKAIVHRDDNDIADPEDAVEEQPPASPLAIFKSNLTRLWDRISELQVSMSRMNDDLREYQLSVTKTAVNQELKAEQPISENSETIVQSEVSSIRVILCLMLFVMSLFVLAAIVKFGKSYVTFQRFYYPSNNLSRSTATIQTTMEHVM